MAFHLSGGSLPAAVGEGVGPEEADGQAAAVAASVDLEAVVLAAAAQVVIGN